MKNASTSMRTWLSVFQKVWTFCLGKELNAPLIECNLNKWEKGYHVTKAIAFEKEDLGNLLFTLQFNSIILYRKAS